MNTPSAAENSANLPNENTKRKRLPRFSRQQAEGFVRFFSKPFFLYLLCFIMPAGIMYLAYALFKVHPFGDGSVLVLDLNGQYVYYYEAFRDAIMGDGSLVYNWSRNLSGNMFGIFAYYLASPFMLITCIFPRSAMCGAIETMQILKIGTAGATFAHFLLRTADKTPRRTSVVAFSSMYALMAYMVVQLMDPMWLDGLIYLPLICLGVKRLLKEGKMLPYIIPLTLMFIAHFYIGYMIAFFTFCYFVTCFFGEEGRIAPKHFMVRIFQFIGASLTAAITACCVLIPVYNALKLGKLEFSTPDWSMATQFDFLTFLTKLFPFSYDTVYPEGLPMIYCGAAVLILVPLFFMNRRIGIKTKVSNGLLMASVVVFMYLRPVDIVWHGFQVPNWLPFRYSFAFSFLLLTMAFKAFENLDGITPKEIGGVFFGLAVFLFWCERENYDHFQIFRTVKSDNGEDTSAIIGGIWFSLIALLIYFLLIYLNRKYKTSRILALITCVAVGLELLANTMDTLQKIDDDVVYSDYTSYEPYMSDTIDAVKHIKSFDDDKFYRMEATFHRTVNDPIGTGYSGISHSSSVMNAPALTMLKQLGYAYGGHYTKYEGSTYITDSVFDIRYLMDKEAYNGEKRYMDDRTKVPEDYKLATHIDETDAKYKFYRNPYAMGLGTVCSENINSIELTDVNPFENQNVLYSALCGKAEITNYFSRIMPKSEEKQNLRESNLNDDMGHKGYYTIDKSKGEAHIDYIIEMDRDSDLYMYLPTKYERNCNVWVLDEEKYINGDGVMDYAGQFFVGDNYSILNLGSFLQNEEVRIRITIDNDDDEAYWCDELFYSFDHDTFAADAEALAGKAMNVTEFDNTSLTAECTAESEGQYLFTTIPDEPGWVVKVNGKQVRYSTSMGTLITVPLERGENTVTMEFKPSYYTGAKMISLAGLLIIAVIFLFEYKNGKILLKLVTRASHSGEPPKPAPTSQTRSDE